MSFESSQIFGSDVQWHASNSSEKKANIFRGWPGLCVCEVRFECLQLIVDRSRDLYGLKVYNSYGAVWMFFEASQVGFGCAMAFR